MDVQLLYDSVSSEKLYPKLCAFLGTYSPNRFRSRRTRNAFALRKNFAEFRDLFAAR